jgi:hypothetical protein
MRVSTSFRRGSEVAEIEPVNPWRQKPSGPNTFVHKFMSKDGTPMVFCVWFDDDQEPVRSFQAPSLDHTNT